MSLQRQISNNVSNLTDTEKQLLQSLLLDQQKLSVEDFTVSKIAIKYNVSRTSVHRLSQKIGYTSFTLFKKDFFLNENEETFVNKQTLYLDRIIENYNIVQDSITDDILKAIITAQRIVIYGMGMSSYIGKMFQVKLLLLGINSEQYDDSRFMRLSAANLNPETDIIIVLSRSGKPPELIEAIVIATTKNVPVILVTENSDSPLGNMATHIISTSHSIDRDVEIDTRINVHLAMDLLMNKLVDEMKKE